MMAFHQVLPLKPVILQLIFVVLHQARAGSLPALYKIQVTREQFDDFKKEHFDVWTYPTFGRPVQAAVYTEDEETRITAFLTKHNLPMDRTELAPLLEESEARMRGRASLKEPGKVTWDNYYTLDEVVFKIQEVNYKRLLVYTWLDGMCQKYPNLAKCTEIGKSLENRPMKMIQISNGKSNPEKKSAFLDSTIHAREWITLSYTTYMINELLVNSNDYRYQHLLDKLDIFIIPIANPDGYAYSHTPGKRLWRKNRRPHPSGQGNDDCNGVDLNRNFDYKWDAVPPDGSNGAQNPCSMVYGGPSPFSEPESQVIRDTVLKERGRARFYFTIHAFGQVWLTPWAYDGSTPQDHPDLSRVAACGANASTQVYGVQYRSGTVFEMIKAYAAGAIGDWVKGGADVKYGFGIELRPSDEPPGFDLPVDQILPTVKEAWVGILTALLECNVPEPPAPPTSAKPPSPSKAAQILYSVDILGFFISHIIILFAY